MPKRYIHNDTDRDKIVGGVLIAPGQGREVDTALLPPEAAEETPAKEPEQPPDPLANLRDLLKAPVKDITPQLEGFSAETLAALAELENASETPRSTLLAAIGAEQLKQAQKVVGGPT